MSAEYVAREILCAASERKTDLFCNYRGYIKLNRSKFESDLEKLSRGIKRELRGKSSVINDEDVSNFLYSNAWILGGFAAGWLIGYGIA
uniref:FUN14 family protein n=1 Tax=Heterorhabditis bacteriophora TaxID=37862 RepID=A0A1I7WSY2_HETBA